MNWQRIRGHQRQREMFARAVARQRLGQAYLLLGPAGIGKRTFAVGLAEALLCQRRQPGELTACGECPGCRQVLSRTHPDFMQVGLPPGKTELPIDVFVGSPEKRGREGLCYELSLKPMHGGHRVAIVDDADKMNVASANSLLKTLEEPGPGAVLILIAADPDQVIQTIRSRCQQVFFGPLVEPELRGVLAELAEQQEELAEPLRDSARLERAIQEAEGSVGRAVEVLSRSDELQQSRQRLQGVLNQPGFRVQQLASAGEAVMAQMGSETAAQRDGALTILGGCLQHFHERLQSHPPGTVTEQQRDVWADALELCLETTIQIDRRAAVNLCLEAFYQELEIRLRPTWKKSAARS